MLRTHTVLHLLSGTEVFQTATHSFELEPKHYVVICNQRCSFVKTYMEML
jgi:hypothetical protein